jgi:hypothetical protein
MSAAPCPAHRARARAFVPLRGARGAHGAARAFQEAALQLVAQAIANEDHEFGLELCKRASSVIYDPRIPSLMGECERPSRRPARARGAQLARWSHACVRRLRLLLSPPAPRSAYPLVQATKSRETRWRRSARTALHSPWTPPSPARPFHQRCCLVRTCLCGSILYSVPRLRPRARVATQPKDAGARAAPHTRHRRGSGRRSV